MKSYTGTTTHAMDIFDGDVKPAQAAFTYAGRTPGFQREFTFYENFPRFKTGQPAASCGNCSKISALDEKTELAHAVGESMEIN
jgi:hypothetical protein